MHRISPIPLTVQAFADFGDVVEASPEKMFSINKGTTNRFHDLANIDVERDGGRPVVNIFRGTPYPFPLTIRMMEKHPLGSQFFMPLDPFDYLVAVAEAKSTVMPEDVLVFSCSHKQGVNFKTRSLASSAFSASRTAGFFGDRSGRGRRESGGTGFGFTDHG